MVQTATQPRTRSIRDEMTKILTEQPMISSTALFMKHDVFAAGGPDKVAATDGTRVMVWPRFFEYQPQHRLGILLHEYLHAAFAHPLRGARLRRRFGSAYRHDVMNVAADAIINAAVRSGTSSRIDIPADGVDLQKIAAQAKAIVDLTGLRIDLDRLSHLGKLSLEWLYETMLALEEAARQSCASDQESGPEDGSAADPQEGEGQPGAAGGDPATGAGGAGGPANDNAGERERGKDPKRDARDDFLRHFGQPQDIIEIDVSGMTIEEVTEGIRQAGDRIQAAASMHGKGHGSGTRNVLELLEGDIPRVDTPWESSFRSITQRHLAPQRMRQPTRPGRRVLTQEAMGMHSIVWSPGRRRPPVPLVMVVLDSSGSIVPAEYKRYLGEIQAMKRRTNARIVAVVADDRIQSVTDIKDVREVANVDFKGRGGTDFREPIALAEQMQADLVVYLTDLMGTFPDEAPPMPVLWTINGSETPSGYEPPFGRVLHLR